MQISAARASSILLLIIYLGFISLGLPDGTFGVAWPAAHLALGLPIGLAGVIAVLVTMLSACSAFASGRIIGRFKTGRVVLASCLMTGGALLLISNANGLTGLLLACVPLGLGAGAVDAGLNGYVARHYTGKHMNWLHACWGIGATIGPVLMSHALGTGAGWRAGYQWIGGAQLCLAVLFLLTLRLWSIVPERTAHEAAAGLDLPKQPTATANSFAGWLSVVIFALYVAVEGTTGVWAGSILVVARGFSPEIAGLCTASFYASITAGRILSGMVVARWGNRRMISFGVGVAFLGGLVFTQASTAPVATLALVLLGLGFSPVYPCLMHEVPRRFAPEAVQTVIGRQSGAGSVGGALLPSGAGWLAQVSIVSITWTVVAGTILLALALRRLNKIT